MLNPSSIIFFSLSTETDSNVMRRKNFTLRWDEELVGHSFCINEKEILLVAFWDIKSAFDYTTHVLHAKQDHPHVCKWAVRGEDSIAIPTVPNTRLILGIAREGRNTSASIYRPSRHFSRWEIQNGESKLMQLALSTTEKFCIKGISGMMLTQSKTGSSTSGHQGMYHCSCVARC